VKCKAIKPGIEFNVSSGSKDGLAFRCKPCQQEDYANADKARLKVARADWYQNNKTNLKQTRKAYRAKNKARIADKEAERRQKNNAKEKARHAAYALKNKAKMRAYHAAKWQGNKASMYARNRAWAKKNPQKVAVLMQRRRARIAATLATLTAEQWSAILVLYEGKCAYCGKAGKMTMDHVVPVIRGGGTTANNVVPACQSCNSSKGTKTPEEWRN
jgi:5-methylcytosine-specific restriction endonuclease McrA